MKNGSKLLGLVSRTRALLARGVLVRPLLGRQSHMLPEAVWTIWNDKMVQTDLRWKHHATKLC